MTTTLGPPRNPVPRAVVEQSATNRGGGSPTEEPAEVNPARQRGNWTLQLTRGAAVLTTFAIGGASFLLSFKSLNDLASRAALWSDVAWLWPLTVDMTIVSATMAIVALAGYADQGRNRKFFWALLVCAAMISVGGNALHALLPRDTPLNPWLSAGIAMVPPLLLLATTHGLAVLWRFRASPASGDRGGADCRAGE